MELFIQTLETLLKHAVSICTPILELIGIVVLMVTAVKCFINWLQKSSENIPLQLAEGIALALEFKMGGEVLKTVVVQTWSELGILGAIIGLRAILTLLIHWEIKSENVK